MRVSASFVVSSRFDVVIEAHFCGGHSVDQTAEKPFPGSFEVFVVWCGSEVWTFPDETL